MALLLTSAPTGLLANDSVLRLEPDVTAAVNPGINYANWRYSALAQINNKNAGKLKLDWALSTGSLQGHTGTPLVIPAYVTGLNNPVIIIHTANPDKVMAVDLVKQEQIWIYEPELDLAGYQLDCCRSQNQGISYADGRIFVQLSNHRLVALDARRGNEIWQVPTGNASQWSDSVSATTAVNDFILTGFESFGRQGMAAHSINTGRIVWRAFHQGAANEMLNDVTTRILGQRPATNLSLDDNKQTLPGQVAWDAQSNTVFYVSTAQTGTDPVNQSPLFSTTIHARDTETGISRWQYQIAPQAGLAVSTTGEIILLNMEDETGLLPVLVYFANNGFVYTLERASGQFIKAEQFAEASNWAELINPETGMPVLIEDEDEGIGKTICPSSLGARSHQPSAYNPRTNLFYIQPHQTCMQFTEVEMENDSENAMTLNSLEIIQLPLPQQTQIEMSLVPAQGVSNTGTANLGSVAAWDMNNNSQRWTIDEAWPVMSGLLTTAGDVVYYGTLDGYIKAVDAKTGAYLWHFRAPSGITGNFVTWEYKSKQYLAVVSGSADSASLLAGDETKEIPIQGGGSLLVFSLP